MPQFLVGRSEQNFSELDFVLVDARDEHEAEELAVRNFFAPNDEQLLETVRDRSVNMSLAEYFWLQTDEEKAAFSEEGGKIIASREQFEQRVRRFFGAEHQAFAESYLRYMTRGSEIDELEVPIDVLVFLWLSPYEWSRLSVVSLADVPRFQAVVPRGRRA